MITRKHQSETIKSSQRAFEETRDFWEKVISDQPKIIYNDEVEIQFFLNDNPTFPYIEVNSPLGVNMDGIEIVNSFPVNTHHLITASVVKTQENSEIQLIKKNSHCSIPIIIRVRSSAHERVSLDMNSFSMLEETVLREHYQQISSLENKDKFIREIFFPYGLDNDGIGSLFYKDQLQEKIHEYCKRYIILIWQTTNVPDVSDEKSSDVINERSNNGRISSKNISVKTVSAYQSFPGTCGKNFANAKKCLEKIADILYSRYNFENNSQLMRECYEEMPQE